MKRCYTIFLIIALISFVQIANAKVYECTYKNKNGATVVSSFNPIYTDKPHYQDLLKAYNAGKCKELHVKKYLIDATSCNIQFYKHNWKIGNLACNKNKQEPLNKLKNIAREDFGYFESRY